MVGLATVATGDDVVWHRVQVMAASRVGVTAGLCDLITGMTSGPGCATFGGDIAVELEKLFVYSLVWSVGGLLEFEDR